MGAEVIAAIIAAVGSLVATGVSAGIGGAASEANLNMARMSRKYTMGLQLLNMYREDTAVRRRVNDLKKAGLSPVLAAGSPASSQPAVKIETPQYDPQPVQAPLQSMAQLMPSLINSFNQTQLTQKNLEKIQSETEKIDQQRMLDMLKFPEEMKKIQSTYQLNNQTTALRQLQTLEASIEYWKTKETGFSNKTAYGQMIRELTGTYATLKQKFIQKYGEEALRAQQNKK